MKKLIAGGFLFVAGCIFCALGMLGLAATHTTFGYYDTLHLIYIGIPTIIVGIILGVLGLREEDK